eukprot:CAMPEP_0180311660 /NCGR_PEP_ID=MMETSP0988-20121125/30384_1 /TAXON_ID=697907 /ORGANISM="non described non described, Strain CCMP2293" /LENGTH=385 /DNA_ID=CAMNT_0022295787 /DNA_START=78 /DNA_END=1236 /DNA_ORIENTATION=+
MPPTYTANTPKVKAAFATAHPTKLDAHTTDVQKVITFMEVAVTCSVEGSSDRTAVRAKPRAGYNLFVYLAKDFDLSSLGIKPSDNKTFLQVLHSAGITIGGNAEANGTAFLDVLSSVIESGISGFDGGAIEIALEARTEELEPLVEPDEDDENVEEQRAEWEVHSSALQEDIDRIFPLSKMYIIALTYLTARTEGTYDLGAPATRHAQRGDRDAARDHETRLPPLGYYPQGSPPLARECTAPKLFAVLREWAPLAEPRAAEITATAQLMARGGREVCDHCGIPGHGQERCWKLLREQGKPTPPEAKFFEQRQEQKSKVESERKGAKVLSSVLTKPWADKVAVQLAVAIKDICDTMSHEADVVWTLEKKMLLATRARAMVYDIAAS